MQQFPEVIPEEWPIRYPGAAWVRLLLFSFIGVAPAPVVTWALIGIDLSDLTGLDHALDIPIVVVAGLVLLACIVLPLLCLKIREPGPAKVVFDRWGVTEWDGDLVRTAISWPRAALWTLETRIRNRRWGTVYLGGMKVSVASDRGWAINVMWGTGVPRAAWRHRMMSKVDFPPTALDRFKGFVRGMPAPVVDPREDRRPLFYLARTLGFFFLCAVGAAFSQMADLGPNGQLATGFFFSVSALVAMGRMARPIAENFRLSREAAPCARAQPVVLPGGNDGPFVVAAMRDGRQCTLDFSAVSHPDELLVRRGGNLLVAIDGVGAGDAYRGAPMRVLAAETDRDRRERARIRRANRIELLARFTLVALLLVSGGILLANLQVH